MDTENDYENKSTDKLKLADEFSDATLKPKANEEQIEEKSAKKVKRKATEEQLNPVSYTNLRAHETVLDLVCRLLLDK